MLENALFVIEMLDSSAVWYSLFLNTWIPFFRFVVKCRFNWAGGGKDPNGIFLFLFANGKDIWEQHQMQMRVCSINSRVFMVFIQSLFLLAKSIDFFLSSHLNASFFFRFFLIHFEALLCCCMAGYLIHSVRFFGFPGSWNKKNVEMISFNILRIW